MRPLWLIVLVVLACGCAPKGPSASHTVPPLISFQDVTSAAGISWTRVNGAAGKYWLPETMGGGGALFDYNNDGLLDILLVNGKPWTGSTNGPLPTLALFRNIGRGRFSDVTEQVGLKVPIQGMGAAVGDFDNDGWDDLFISGVGESLLFRNMGGKRFHNATSTAGVNSNTWSTSAAWSDVDNDGLLDLFVCTYVRWTPATDKFCGTKGFKSYCRPQEYQGQSCLLYRNLGNGRFVDVTKSSGIWNENAKALGICAVDIEDDGDMDLIVANDMEPNFVFRNDGKGKFSEVGFDLGLSVDESGRSRAGMGVDTGDWNGTGTHAIAIGNFSYEGLAFYPLDETSPLPERSRQTGLYSPSYPFVTFGLAFADFDNDRRPDLCITNGHIEDSISSTSPGQSYEQPCVLYRNRGGSFEDVSRSAGEAVTRPLVGRGLCRGDYDNDGRMDLLLIPNRGAPRLLKNTSTKAGNWVTIRLKGKKSNRNGYGAKVTLHAGGQTQTAWCRSGSSYLSASDTRVHFGLGAAPTINRLTVRWPSGEVQLIPNPSVNREIVVSQVTE